MRRESFARQGSRKALGPRRRLPITRPNERRKRRSTESSRPSNQLRKDAGRTRPCWPMLTDEGFLPNYAFPEAAVPSNPCLWRRPCPAARVAFSRWPQHARKLPTEGYERPAAARIREAGGPWSVLMPRAGGWKGRSSRPQPQQAPSAGVSALLPFRLRGTDDDFGRKECPTLRPTVGYAIRARS